MGGGLAARKVSRRVRYFNSPTPRFRARREHLNSLHLRINTNIWPWLSYMCYTTPYTFCVWAKGVGEATPSSHTKKFCRFDATIQSRYRSRSCLCTGLPR